MKKLGLVGGMGPESTIPYYHDIVYGVQNRIGENFFPNLMLMYGKEANNRKQEIDRQHHTIPNKKAKDQKTSTVEMCITCLSLRYFYPHLFETARILGV